MSSRLNIELDAVKPEDKQRMLRGSQFLHGTASAAIVNRTHRVVRARAGKMQVQRKRVRSLWIPLGVSACLLVVLMCALWTAFEEFETSPAGLPDTSQMLVLMMWSVPISVMLMAVVWFRRMGSGTDSERAG